MITTNVLNRVFKIQAATDRIGTAFTIDYGSKQYLVTARHVVEQLDKPYRVQLYYDSKWWHLNLELTGMSNHADVAVFRPDTRLSPDFPLPPSVGGLIYGQDVYFLGYPYGMQSLGTDGEKRPLPLVKKGCLSAFIPGEPHGNFLLDGHNNRGFSGGPVVFRDEPPPADYKVFGVVSAYLPRYEEVQVKGRPQPDEMRLNTGIMLCSSIKYALDAIEANPNGLELGASG